MTAAPTKTITIDGPGLNPHHHHTITVTADSAVELVKWDDPSSYNTWMALLVDGRHYNLVMWKHTIGRPHLTIEIQQVAAEIQSVIDSLKIPLPAAADLPSAAAAYPDFAAAIAAFHQILDANAADQIARDEAERQEIVNRTLGMLSKTLGHPVTCEMVTIKDRVVTYQGVRFVGRVMLGSCPTCGEETVSDSISSTYELGQLLVEFLPHFDHTHCRTQSQVSLPEPTLAERLEQTIRDIVEEVLVSR